ncbi:MAG TPA: alanine racemase C-terminal domain-containing protein [Lacisediminihabitans sp.]|uniref:alanine racemase n=1 Tax=Lacisediminihabitans sp. TaxID=2787631 RepID=UPI002ED77B20
MTAESASVPAAPFREIELDLDALAANVARFRELTDGAPLFVDLGADAWGHGLAVIAPALVSLGAEAFFVSRLDEAERLRPLTPRTLIVTTQHSIDEDFRRAAALRVAPLVRSPAEYLRAVAGGVDGLVLAEDTGSGLPGLGATDLATLGEDARRRGLAVLLDTEFPAIGAELLGLSERELDVSEDFRPVLRLWAPVAATKRVHAGAGVSYGYTYTTTTETTLALVTLGYADGLDRAAGNRGRIAIADRTVTIAGRVAMDAFMVDLGDVTAPPLGTPVTVIGDREHDEPTAFDLAGSLGTVSAEITTRLSARPRRRGRSAGTDGTGAA